MRRVLFQKVKTGKIRKIEISLDGDEIKTTWGFSDSNLTPQETTDIVKEVYYPGHLSYKTSEDQAKIEFTRKYDRLIKEGNKITIEEAQKSDPSLDIVLYPLSTSFRPSKPISKKPCLDADDPVKCNIPNRIIQKLIDNGRLLCQKKYNGIRALLVKADGEFHLYTGTSKDSTANFDWLIQYFNNYAKDYIPDESMLDMELIVGNGASISEFETLKSMKPNTLPVTANQIALKYLQKNEDKTLSAAIFDVVFWGSGNTLKLPYFERMEMAIAVVCHAENNKMNQPTPITLNDVKIDPNKIKTEFPWTSKDLDEAMRHVNLYGWEGLVLRDRLAISEYSMSSKWFRPVGTYKWKSTKTGDFIITGTREGSGANSNTASSFELSQYDKHPDQGGVLINCGHVGSGINDAMIESGLENFIGSVAEVKFFARFVDTAKGIPSLQFPVYIGIRDDKIPSDCLLDEDE